MVILALLGAVRCSRDPSVDDRTARDYVRPRARRFGNCTKVGGVPSRPVPRPENQSSPTAKACQGNHLEGNHLEADSGRPPGFSPSGRAAIPSVGRLSAQLAIAISTPPLPSWCGIDRPSGAGWHSRESAGRPRSCRGRRRGAPGRPDTGTIGRRCGLRSRRRSPN